MAFGKSVINKGPETHSDPVIDLTAGVHINTHSHTQTEQHGWMTFLFFEPYMHPHQMWQ